MTRRVQLPAESFAGGRARLTPGARHYLIDVLRLEEGAALEVFDGAGGVYAATLGPGEELALGPRRQAPPPGARVWLAFALAKGEKCDWVVQKATELGVERLLPFAAERSVVRLEAKRAAERTRRWQRIAAEAARQSGRSEVPAVEAPVALAEVLGRAPEPLVRLLFHPEGGAPLAELARPGVPGYLALVGPEGGLTPAEVQACLAAGARLASLGPRVLRAETAAIVAAALLQHRAGDLG